MEANKNEEVLIYPQHLQQEALQFKKRVTVQEFKAIDSKRIKKEFNVLQQSKIPNYNNVMHLGEKYKDRYSNIHTYKHNRINVKSIENFYVNASQMKSVLDNNVYAIFAQAPLESVYSHFWSACYYFKIVKIIMLCSFVDPHRGPQAEKYWPELNKSVNYENQKIRVICTSVQKISDEYTRTLIVLKGPQGDHQIQHIHWTGWSDMKKPFGEKNEGLFRNLVEDSIKRIDNKELIMIHCSAGIGRTGTLGTMIEALRCAKKQNKLSVFEIVDNMRRHRMACVQTMEQYNFIYQQLKIML